MFEAFARETQVYGHPIGPTEQCKSIEAVKKADIIKLCRNLLASKPAIALLGKLHPEGFSFDTLLALFMESVGEFQIQASQVKTIRNCMTMSVCYNSTTNHW